MDTGATPVDNGSVKQTLDTDVKVSDRDSSRTREEEKELRRSRSFVKRILEFSSIVLVSIGTIFIVMLSFIGPFSVMLDLIIGATLIVLLFSYMSSIHPFKTHIIIWYFWIIYNFMFLYYTPHSDELIKPAIASESRPPFKMHEPFGFGDTVSIVVTVIVYIPISIACVAEWPPFIREKQNFVLYILLVVASLTPVKSTNIFRQTFWNTIARMTMYPIIYMAMVYKYKVVNKLMPSRYGVTTSICSIHILFAYFWLSVATFVFQMIVIALKFIRGMDWSNRSSRDYSKKVSKKKGRKTVEEGGEYSDTDGEGSVSGESSIEEDEDSRDQQAGEMVANVFFNTANGDDKKK